MPTIPVILLTHTPEMRRAYYGGRALAGLRELGTIRLHEADAPLDAEGQALETVAQVGEILQGRAPEGADCARVTRRAPVSAPSDRARRAGRRPGG